MREGQRPSLLDRLRWFENTPRTRRMSTQQMQRLAHEELLERWPSMTAAKTAYRRRRNRR